MALPSAPLPASSISKDDYLSLVDILASIDQLSFSARALLAKYRPDEVVAVTAGVPPPPPSTTATATVEETKKRKVEVKVKEDQPDVDEEQLPATQIVS